MCNNEEKLVKIDEQYWIIIDHLISWYRHVGKEFNYGYCYDILMACLNRIEHELVIALAPEPGENPMVEINEKYIFALVEVLDIAIVNYHLHDFDVNVLKEIYDKIRTILWN